jgi:hypothetical protein
MVSTVILTVCGQGDDGTVNDGSGSGGVCPKPHPRDSSEYYAFFEKLFLINFRLWEVGRPFFGGWSMSYAQYGASPKAYECIEM